MFRSCVYQNFELTNLFSLFGKGVILILGED